MVRIKLNTYKLVETAPGLIAYALCLGEQTPSKTVEIKTVADAQKALADFAEEMKATGKPWHISALFDRRSGRKPNGFDKARLEANVNEHLVAR